MNCSKGRLTEIKDVLENTNTPEGRELCRRGLVKMLQKRVVKSFQKARANANAFSTTRLQPRVVQPRFDHQNPNVLLPF